MSKRATLVFLSFLSAVLCGGCGGGGGSGSASNDSKSEDIGPVAGSSYERHTFYSIPNNNGDFVEYYTIDIKDSSGNLLQTVRYSSPGHDGKWHTGDDEIEYYSRYVDTGLYKTQDVYTYLGRGPDRKWFTGDDVRKAYTKTIPLDDHTIRTTVYVDPGPDGKWLSGDDRPESYWEETYNSSGKPIAKTQYRKSEFGDQFIINGFHEAHYSEFRYDSKGRETLRISSIDKGPDGKWFTDDDYGFEYIRSQYNESGLLEKEISCCEPQSNSGSDGQFMTDDDIPYAYKSYEYGAAGRISTILYKWSPGNDSAWFTPDDIVDIKTEYSYSPQGRLKAVRYCNMSLSDTGDSLATGITEYFNQFQVPVGLSVSDVTPPYVIGSSPFQGATDVDVGIRYISVEFSESPILYLSMLDYSQMPGFTASDICLSDKTLYIYLENFIPKGHTTYALTITGLMDQAGNVMPPETISFTTGDMDKTPPVLTGTWPSDGETVHTNNERIHLDFDEPVAFDLSMLSISPEISGLSPDLIYTSDSFASIDLSGIVALNQTYTITLTGVHDKFGNIMEPRSFSFTFVD